MDKWPAYARLSTVAPAGHLPTASQHPQTPSRGALSSPRGVAIAREMGGAVASDLTHKVRSLSYPHNLLHWPIPCFSGPLNQSHCLRPWATPVPEEKEPRPLTDGVWQFAAPWRVHYAGDETRAALGTLIRREVERTHQVVDRRTIGDHVAVLLRVRQVVTAPAADGRQVPVLLDELQDRHMI